MIRESNGETIGFLFANDRLKCARVYMCIPTSCSPTATPPLCRGRRTIRRKKALSIVLFRGTTKWSRRPVDGMDKYIYIIRAYLSPGRITLSITKCPGTRPIENCRRQQLTIRTRYVRLCTLLYIGPKSPADWFVNIVRDGIRFAPGRSNFRLVFDSVTEFFVRLTRTDPRNDRRLL